jgi:intein-encoded DNA endonuclease-like protein
MVSWDYIAGFFDADGCVTQYRDKSGRLVTQLTFTNTNYGVLKAIRDFLGLQRLSINRRKGTRKPAYKLSIGKHEDVLHVGGALAQRCLVKKQQLISKIDSFKLNGRYRRPGELSKAVELRNQGMNLSEIGRELGRSRNTIMRWFDEM